MSTPGSIPKSADEQHQQAVKAMLERQEQGKDRDEAASLATAVEVLDDIRELIAMGIELRDQMAVLVRKEGPVYLKRLADILGHTEDEIVDAVVRARAEARIDLEKYKLKHHPSVVKEMQERFGVQVVAGKDRD
jgi:hypothetical protein